MNETAKKILEQFDNFKTYTKQEATGIYDQIG